MGSHFWDLNLEVSSTTAVSKFISAHALMHGCFAHDCIIIARGLTLTMQCVRADTPPWGDGHVNFLSPLLQLETLDLARTYVGSAHLQVLGKLTNLRQLDISHTDLEGTTLRAVSPALTGLERLDVSYAPVVSLSTPLAAPSIPIWALSCLSLLHCALMHVSLKCLLQSVCIYIEIAYGQPEHTLPYTAVGTSLQYVACTTVQVYIRVRITSSDLTPSSVKVLRGAALHQVFAMLPYGKFAAVCLQPVCHSQ